MAQLSWTSVKRIGAGAARSPSSSGDTAHSLRLADATFIAAWFTLSRVVAFASGVSYTNVRLEDLWQLLPLELLRDQPLESLWYLHAQPPLYNAFVAIALRLPIDAASAVHLWMMTGFLMLLAVFVALRLGGASQVFCHLAVMVFGLNPTLVLYENFLLYTYPESALVLGALAGLFWFGQRQSGGRGLFVLCCSTLVAMRAAFQLPWALSCAIAPLLPRSGRRTIRTGAMFLVPCLIAGLLTLKNGLMFTVWTTSSWYGMNAASFARAAVAEELQLLVQEGAVSSSFQIGGFQAVSNYPLSEIEAEARHLRRRHGAVPALEVPRSRTAGNNYNHAGYVTVSRQLAAERRLCSACGLTRCCEPSPRRGACS